MDPNACLERLRGAYGSSDYDEVQNASSDLLNWVHKGGFLPTVTEPQLSTLLIMAVSYGKRMEVEHTPDYGDFNVSHNRYNIG